jgi:hypothetical protein
VPEEELLYFLEEYFGFVIVGVDLAAEGLDRGVLVVVGVDLASAGLD